MPSRRRFLAVAGTGVLGATAGCTSLLEPSESGPGGRTSGPGFSDREFGSDATATMVRHDATNASAAPSAVGPDEAPAEAWSTDRTLGSPARPTVLGDMVFTHGINGLCGFTTGGDRRWAYDTNGGELNPGPVAVVRDRVFASRGTALVVLDAKAGIERTVWVPPVETHRLSPPAVDGDTVYVAGQHPNQPPTLWAIDRLDGSLGWRVELGGESVGAPIVGPDRVFTLTTNGGLYAVSLADEAVDWQRRLPAPIGVPAVADGGVFVETGDDLRRYRTDGTPEWTTPSTGAFEGPHSGPVVDGDTVYTATLDGGGVRAHDVATGEEQWLVEVETEARAPVPTDRAVYVQDSSQTLLNVGAADGTVRWSERLDLRSGTGVAVGDGAAFAGGDGRLARFD